MAWKTEMGDKADKAEKVETGAVFLIGMLIFDGMSALDIAGPWDVFARMPGVRIVAVAPAPQAVRSDTGLVLTPDATYDLAARFDLVCVPGGPGVNALMEDPKTGMYLQHLAGFAKLVVGVGTGALVLGAAGLLHGYRATTHWAATHLIGMFGALEVRERVVVDRDRVTCGGGTASVDMALTVCANLFGQAVAREICLMLEYDPKPPVTGGSPATALRKTIDSVAYQSSRHNALQTQIAIRASKRLTGEL